VDFSTIEGCPASELSNRRKSLASILAMGVQDSPRTLADPAQNVYTDERLRMHLATKCRYGIEQRVRKGLRFYRTQDIE
jgi:hypothetical protein